MNQLSAILFFVSVSSFSFAQETLYTYSFSVDTTSNSEHSKEVLTYIEREFEMEYKLITGKHQFTMNSLINTSEEIFGLLLNSLGYQLTSFTRVAQQEAHYDTKTDPGGVNCGTASIVCSNDSFNGTATGFGVQELNNANHGCLAGNEHQSSWYYINVDAGGTLNMLIDPVNNNDDYDFAIWGPFTSANAAANCPPVSAPIRCSYSANTDVTGLGPYWGITSYTCGPWYWPFDPCYGWITPTDNTEGAGGDSYVSTLNVSAGQIYIMVVDNFSNSGQPYGLSWGGTASLDCTPVVLPVEVSNFTGKNEDNTNRLKWSTASENGNDYFLIERSVDNENWSVIDNQSGAGYSESTLNYLFDDYTYRNTLNYYRLSQVDFNGEVNRYKTIAIDNTITDKSVVKIVNMLGQEVDEDFTGARLVIYSDGSIVRKVGN